MKHADDGFVSRFQAVVFPDDVPYVHIDRPPNIVAEERAKQVYKALANIDFRKWGATGGDGEIPCIRCGDEAQSVMDDWLIELETRLSNSKEHPLILEHLAKFRSFVPSLALINHLVRKADERSEDIGQVCRKDVELAIAQSEYFESHARRMYGLVLGGLTASTRLASRILAGDITDVDDKGAVKGFTVRDVYRNGWSQLSTVEVVEEACKVLVGKKWLRQERSTSGAYGGRPSVVYRINPKVYQWADISNS